MFTMIQRLGLRQSLSAEAPYLLLSFFIAEWLYKFHSFTLECLAFLATWFILSAIGTKIGEKVRS